MSFIEQILTESGLECIWKTQTFTSKASVYSHVRDYLKQTYITSWQNDLNNSSKCLLYKNYKKTIQAEPFLKYLPEKFAIALLKFRCNNHKLPIEVERKQGVPRDRRICKKCDMNVIGDEFHLIFECPVYNAERQKYIPSEFRRVKSTFNLCNLFKSSSKKMSLKLAKFLVATKSV